MQVKIEMLNSWLKKKNNNNCLYGKGFLSILNIRCPCAFYFLDKKKNAHYVIADIFNFLSKREWSDFVNVFSGDGTCLHKNCNFFFFRNIIMNIILISVKNRIFILYIVYLIITFQMYWDFCIALYFHSIFQNFI